PANMELAPAKKHMAWPSRLIWVRPAESLTCVCGITILAVATIRTISQISTGFCSSIGVPSTATKALIGTDSGCGLSVDEATNIPARSSTFSRSEERREGKSVDIGSRGQIETKRRRKTKE